MIPYCLSLRGTLRLNWWGVSYLIWLIEQNAVSILNSVVCEQWMGSHKIGFWSSIPRQFIPGQTVGLDGLQNPLIKSVIVMGSWLCLP
jgi:hypothetical protein